MSALSNVLTLSCANRPGIVAKVSTALFDGGFNILDAQQFDDTETGNFFMRVVFDSVADAVGLEAFRERFVEVGAPFSMNWSIRADDERKRVLILVSRFDHCLVDLLYRWRNGELPMEIVGIGANYPREAYAHIDFGDIPFHFLPVTKQTKLEQETQVWALVRQSKADVVVLARYMQILSDGLAAKLLGRCINIHHSFLPGFKGAKPYHQAHHRGVKLIGATAHYVTSDLDEGADHRTGRRADQPSRHARGSHTQGPRYRTPGAVARPRASSRRPRVAQSRQDGGVRRMSARLSEARLVAFGRGIVIRIEIARASGAPH
jgi:formyltetrahydrofolate deformylase